MLEIGSFFGKCSFRGFSGTNGDSLIFPKLWGQGNRYLNGENWGIFEVGTVQYFGEYWGQIPQISGWVRGQYFQGIWPLLSTTAYFS